MPPKEFLLKIMKPWWKALFCLALLAAQAAWAATETVPSSAQLAFPLENQGESARAIAMGSAFVAVGGDVSALSWNPAGLASLSLAQIALNHHFYLQDFMQDTLFFAIPQGSLGSWGLSVSYLSYGSLTGRDANGTVTGSYSAGRWGGELAWAHGLFQGLSIGLGLKANLLNLSTNSYSNLAGDAGVLWEVSPSFRLGTSYSNWGTDVSTYIANSVLRVGGAYDWQVSSSNKALLAASVSWEPYGVARLDFGAEDLISSLLAVRAGYVADLSPNILQGLTGLTAGLGVRLQDFALDYAYSPFGDLGSSQRISLTYSFPGKALALPAQSTAATARPAPPPAPVTVFAPAVTQTVPLRPATAVATSAPQPGGDKLKLLFSLPPDQAAPSNAGLDEKISAFQAAISVNPQDEKNWYGLGQLYYQNGRKNEAIQCFEQVLRLKPGNTQLKAWLEKYRNQAAP